MSTVAVLQLHHDVELTEALVRRLIWEHGSPTREDGRPVTEEDREYWLGLVMESNFGRGVPGFSFARPRSRGRTVVHLTVGLWESGAYNLEEGFVQIEPFRREPDRWFSVMSGPWLFDPTMDEDAAWFLEHTRPFVPVFQPNFGFADTRQNMFDYIGDDPRKVAWPIMIIGPSEIERWGRAHLLDAPAWRVEELPYGGIWIQAAENPFAVETRDLEALARHLGLSRTATRSPE